jgi:hypothetical protein
MMIGLIANGAAAGGQWSQKEELCQAGQVAGLRAAGTMAAVAASKATRRKRNDKKSSGDATKPKEQPFVPQTIPQPGVGGAPTTTFAQPGGGSAKIMVSPAVWLGTILGMVMLVCVPAYLKYGVNFFLPAGQKMLHHSSEEWQHTLLPQKTMLFIGGHHRGGTTLLWELMAEHPDIGGFGTPFDTGSDYSEGSFLQDVMPTFGVGNEALYNGRGGGMPTGLGTYALGEKEQVSWTEETQKDKLTATRQRRLLNQWGYFWKGAGSWDAPFWIEKTPTNAVVSRFLQALMGLGSIEREEEYLVDGGLLDQAAKLPWERPRGSRTKFLFILRHPLANALATRAFLPHHVSITDLIANWLAIANYIAQDMPHLEHAIVLKLEELVADPDTQLSAVWEFVGVEPPATPRSVVVRKAVNSKYEKMYCDDLNDKRNGKRYRAIHQLLRKQYGEAVRKFGYDLDEWACIADAEKTHNNDGDDDA